MDIICDLVNMADILTIAIMLFETTLKTQEKWKELGIIC